MAYFGVDINVRIDELVHEFKNKLRQKKIGSFFPMMAAFTKADVNGNGKLDLPEFEECLGSFG